MKIVHTSYELNEEDIKCAITHWLTTNRKEIELGTKLDVSLTVVAGKTDSTLATLTYTVSATVLSISDSR